VLGQDGRPFLWRRHEVAPLGADCGQHGSPSILRHTHPGTATDAMSGQGRPPGTWCRRGSRNTVVSCRSGRQLTSTGSVGQDATTCSRMYLA
jgi:hypothetical protein